MISLGTPKESQKLNKCGKRPSQNQVQKNMKKPKIQKNIAQGYPNVTRRLITRGGLITKLGVNVRLLLKIFCGHR